MLLPFLFLQAVSTKTTMMMAITTEITAKMMILIGDDSSARTKNKKTKNTMGKNKAGNCLTF